MSEEQPNLLANEFCKWKNHEQYIIGTFKNLKCSVKQQEELNKSLEDEIDHLNKTKCNITQELMLEMYNQFVTTNDLVKLGELSDHVNSICNDNEERLEICRILKEKNKFILENMETESRQKIAAKKNILKTQSNEIGNIKNNIISLCEILTQERNPFELNTLKEMKQTCTDDLNLILLENEISEKNILKNREKANTVENNKKEITNTLLKKYEETKSISSAIENENVKSDECLNDLNTKISSVLKRFEDINLNIEESKKILKEQMRINADYVKENTKLKCESEYRYQNCSAIEKLLRNEKDKNVRNYAALQRNVELLDSKLQNRESVFIKEEEDKQTAIDNMEVLCADVHKQRSRYNVLQESLNNLDIEIAHLLKTNDQKSKSIDSLSQTNLEKNTYIASIKNNINELKSKMLNLTSTCKNTTDELSKEITTIKMQVDSRNEAIKTEKSKMEKYMEKLEMEEKTKFDERKLQQEKEIENRKESKEAVSDQVKQLSIKLERSTLEVDILLRKIKTAKELISSLKIEYQSKAQKLNNFKYQAKRQIDETSDSSFDGSVPFHERMSMTKKKKNKLQFH